MKQSGTFRRSFKSHAGAVLALCLAFSALFGVVRPSSVKADVALENFWYTMYGVDYSATANGPNGKAEYRYGAGEEFEKVSEEGIPNGTLLYIDAEARSDDGKFWANVSYNGYSAWTPVQQLKKLDKATADQMWAAWEASSAAAEQETSIAAETSTAVEETSAADPQGQGEEKPKGIFQLIREFLGF